MRYAEQYMIHHDISAYSSLAQWSLSSQYQCSVQCCTQVASCTCTAYSPKKRSGILLRNHGIEALTIPTPPITITARPRLQAPANSYRTHRHRGADARTNDFLLEHMDPTFPPPLLPCLLPPPLSPTKYGPWLKGQGSRGSAMGPSRRDHTNHDTRQRIRHGPAVCRPVYYEPVTRTAALASRGTREAPTRTPLAWPPSTLRPRSTAARGVERNTHASASSAGVCWLDAAAPVLRRFGPACIHSAHSHTCSSRETPRAPSGHSTAAASRLCAGERAESGSAALIGCCPLALSSTCEPSLVGVSLRKSSIASFETPEYEERV